MDTRTPDDVREHQVQMRQWSEDLASRYSYQVRWSEDGWLATCSELPEQHFRTTVGPREALWCLMGAVSEELQLRKEQGDHVPESGGVAETELLRLLYRALIGCCVRDCRHAATRRGRPTTTVIIGDPGLFCDEHEASVPCRYEDLESAPAVRKLRAVLEVGRG